MYQYPNKPDEIYHYGIKRRSGRYPWGSGDRPYQSREERKLRKQLDKADKDKEETLKKINQVKNGPNKEIAYLFSRYKMNEKTAILFEKYLQAVADEKISSNEELKRRGLEYYEEYVETSHLLNSPYFKR